MIRRIDVAIALAAAGSWAPAAPAAPPFFIGNWTITRSIRAPGIGPDAAEDRAEVARLVGGTLRFSAGAIAGPRPLPCRAPHYELKDYSPAMLFQGTLTDAGPQAAALGFARPKVRTLETGCGGALDFHFIDAATALFMLNNRIYTIRHDPR